MIYIKLHGRLGNLLFKIAAAASFAKEKNTDFCCVTHKDYRISPPDSNYIEDYIKPYLNNIFRNIKFIKEEDIPNNILRIHKDSFNYEDFEYTDNCYIDGGFQTYKYFDEKLVQGLFSSPQYIIDDIKKDYGELLKEEITCINVRRGDYCKMPHLYPVCSKEYFISAMNIIGKNKKFLFVSDDIQWCKENFKGENIYFFEHKSVLHDLYIQTLCTNNIISNSTFSWWGAYLNPNPNKIVIAPTPWFGICPQTGKLDVSDLYLDLWIKLKNNMELKMKIIAIKEMCKYYIKQILKL